MKITFFYSKICLIIEKAVNLRHRYNQKDMFLDFLFHRKREMLPLPYKREMHCHIIPGVDDGSPEMDFSLQYLKALSEIGLERVIFTPHHTEPNFMNTPHKILPIFNQLKDQAQAQEIPVELEGFSFEYRLDESFLHMMETGKFGEESCELRPLKDHYLLVENSFVQPLLNLDDVLFKLQDMGWYVIMAHPERYSYYSRRGLKQYEHLQDMGVEFQCNLLSFSGYYGESAQKTAYKLLDEGYVNFLGSDLHNMRHVQLIRNFLATKNYAEIRDELVHSIENDKI